MSSLGGRLREVVAYKRFQIQRFDWEPFGILENWSLRRGGPYERWSQPEVRLYSDLTGKLLVFWKTGG